MIAEDTGHFPAPVELPAFPAPGAGSRLIIAVTVIGLRTQGVPDEIVDQWRSNALTAIHPPSPTDSIPPEGKH